ncbi:MAG: ABC transporter permease [Gemmatimonadetes bacterium]|nr:ABC transporter permease [Gemmatimonadota bacterium]
MRILEGVRLATEQMRSQKLKSFFSLLGVIVGVMFLIVVVSIVEGMDRYVRGTFSERLIGVNTVTVLRNPGDEIAASPEQRRAWARAPRLTFDDLDLLRERVTYPAIAGAESDTRGEIESEFGRKVENVTIHAVSAEIFEIRNLEVARGRAFSRQEAEQGAPVVVLGQSTADVLFEAIDPIDKRVRIRGFPHQVIGVLAERGSFLGISLDNTAYAPTHSQVQRMIGPPGTIERIQFKAETPELVVPI